MITFLQGRVDHTSIDILALEVNGVGYGVACAQNVLDQCQPGEHIRLFIHHHIREDQQILYGFLTEDARQLFRQLIQINGVGPKVVLAMFSTLTEAEIIEAIYTRSAKTLAQTPGVGQRLAERIAHELHGKISIIPTLTPTTPSTPSTGGAADVISALLNMGFKEQQVQPVVAQAISNQPEAAFDELLKTSLSSLTTAR